MRARLAVLAVALVVPAPAFPAAALETAVEAVTVYPGDRARVKRAGRVELAAGSQEVVVEGLPAELVDGSIRVSASGAAGRVRVGAVEVERESVSEASRPREGELRTRLKALRADRAAATDRLETARTQLTFVEGLAELPQREGAGSALTGAEAAERWPDLWKRIGEGARQARDAIRQAERKRADLDAEIAALKKELERLGTGEKERVRARIGLAAEAEGPATVTLGYRVRGAGWEPRYAVHLDTADKDLRLVREARVRQATGEDWNGVRLSLATIAPVAGELPELSTWWVDFGGPRPMSDRAAGVAMEKATPAGSARTLHGEFTPTYRVPGSVTVPGSNQPRTVTLGEHELDGEVAVRVVPQQDERAWLTAEAVWEGDGALPPGLVSRFRDGAFVGEGQLTAWSPGEARSLAFGPDPRFGVAFRPMKDVAGEEGLFRKENVRTRHYRIALTNRHGRPVAGSVRFRIPVPRNEAIEVTPWFPEAPDRADVADRKGVYAWDRTFPAGETVVIKAGYRLSMPEGKTVPGF